MVARVGRALRPVAGRPGRGGREPDRRHPYREWSDRPGMMAGVHADHRPRGPAAGGLPGPHRRRAADGDRARARHLHRRGRAGDPPGAAGRLPDALGADEPALVRALALDTGFERRSIRRGRRGARAGDRVPRAPRRAGLLRPQAAAAARPRCWRGPTGSRCWTQVNNPTNLGAIIRSAAGLGMDAVLLCPRSVDHLYRRSIRVSMGEVFSLPVARLEPPWPAGLGVVREAGFRMLALTPGEQAVAARRAGAGSRRQGGAALRCRGPGALAAGARLRRRRPYGSRWRTASTRSTSAPPPLWPSTPSAAAGAD